ncbi:(d)CMP kinase [uncultured Algimonas sp.]|uniref:(d)CMP kinase n=1 Tax=uncultured Algimonas sp. TaxID=1547920 RepID=UPI0026082451|nr:(d)CMP kinase [uncultured Algimonas sp.]
MNGSALIIAIDGTFASGKGTLARRVAGRYGLAHLDTGKLYRAVARDLLAEGGSLEDAERAAQVARRIDADTLDDPYLKSGGMGSAASKVSVHPPVRAALLDYQRKVAARGAVLDGRDIGTVVCPDADVKLFVDAAAEVRARRRFEELKGYGEDVTVEGVLAALRERDDRDMSRATAPLKPAADAHLLDTSKLSIDAAVSAACDVIDAVVNATA